MVVTSPASVMRSMTPARSGLQPPRCSFPACVFSTRTQHLGCIPALLPSASLAVTTPLRVGRARGGIAATAAPSDKGFDPARAKPKRAAKSFEADQAPDVTTAVDSSVADATSELFGLGAASDGLTDFSKTRREYQMYTDVEYIHPRVIGPVEVAAIEGQGRGLTVTRECVPGDLLVLAPSLGWVGGIFGEAPEHEDLHMSMLEDGLGPAKCRVLDALYDGTPESMTKPASMATLDVRFWAGRGHAGGAAPASVDAPRLLRIIGECVCCDESQDAAVMQVRHERPRSYAGLWPEFAMLNHSCLPSASVVVVRGQLLIHAARTLQPGEQVTRSYIGSAVTRPLAERQAALKEFGFECTCRRCQLEGQVSQELQQTLQEAYDWFAMDGSPRFNAWAAGAATDAEGRPDLTDVQALFDEAAILIEEVEAALDAEPDISVEEQFWLKAGAYDLYDLAVTADEVLTEGNGNPLRMLACLKLIRVFAPGSDNHTQVASSYWTEMQAQQEGALGELEKMKLRKLTADQEEQLEYLRALVEDASERYFSAFLSRYGHIQPDLIEQLSQGLGLYNEGLGQLTREAQARSDGSSGGSGGGASTSTNEIMIDGIRVSIVDSVDVSPAPKGAVSVTQGDGMRVVFMDSPAPTSSSFSPGGAASSGGGEEEEEVVQGDGEGEGGEMGALAGFGEGGGDGALVDGLEWEDHGDDGMGDMMGEEEEDSVITDALV